MLPQRRERQQLQLATDSARRHLPCHLHLQAPQPQQVQPVLLQPASQMAQLRAATAPLAAQAVQLPVPLQAQLAQTERLQHPESEVAEPEGLQVQHSATAATASAAPELAAAV